GPPIFSDIAFYAGMAETDWSWTPLVVDFDNDGYRDILITNGFPKDVTDHDFVAFRNKAYNLVSKSELLKQIPEVKRHNYIFRNNGDLTFSNMSQPWGLATPTFSNGAVYVDLDNDGALDLVVNNINDEAMVYRNTTRERDKENHHYLQIAFEGDKQNRRGLGAKASIFYGGKEQVYENSPYRGYLSTVEDIAHFGLGSVQDLDSVVIQWPSHKKQTIQHVKADQLLKVKIQDAAQEFDGNKDVLDHQSLFREITDSVGIHFSQQDRDYIDFNVQKLLPHKFSEYGPSIAIGDVDGNGLDDIVCGGSFFYSAQFFLQQPGGKFIQKPLLHGKDTVDKRCEDEGLLLFDADGDGDLDLYVAAGGVEAPPGSASYEDRLYINDGKGNFHLD
ncbi:MAG TPA: CRTAC1 family protein, partial [Puia sp.]|nr:CRTAC1 family protein [Puia sp.]